MKYKELAAVLRDNIDAGIFHSSKKLPTEDMLMKQFGVTRYCVRNAIELLVGLGCVYPVQGSGTFVRESKCENYLCLNDTRGLQAGLGKENVVTRLISLEVKEADKDLSARMMCEQGTPIYDIIRLRIVKDQPYSVEYNSYNKDIVRYLNKEIAEDSIYSYIHNDLKLNIGFADKVIYCEKLDRAVCELLGLQTGDSGLVVMDDVYLTNGQIFSISKVIYNYKYAKLFSLSNLK